MVSLTHKSTHVANEAEEAALWWVCATLAGGGVGTVRQEHQWLSPPLQLLPLTGFICALSVGSRQASDLKSSYV